MEEVDGLLAQAPPFPASNDQALQWLTAYIQIMVDHRAAATILMTDQAARAEPKIAPQIQDYSRRLEATFEVLDSPDRIGTISVLGAICLAAVRGVLGPDDAGELATQLLPLWRDQQDPRPRSRGPQTRRD